MSAIKFRKRLTKFKITIALPKKFGSKGFINSDWVNYVQSVVLHLYCTQSLYIIFINNDFVTLKCDKKKITINLIMLINMREQSW